MSLKDFIRIIWRRSYLARNRRSEDYMSQYPKLVDLKIALDEEVINNVDRIKGDWGLTSRGQTINGILRNLFEDDLED